MRKYITDIERIYPVVTIVEGNIYNAALNAPHLWELTNGGKIFAHWNGKTIVLSAKGEGSLSFYTITGETDEWVNSNKRSRANDGRNVVREQSGIDP